MSEELRFTGDWPPRQYLEQHSNWTNAWDEEENEDQDETTLKPSDEQRFIDDETTFTVGEAVLADGSKCLAIIQVMDGVPEMIDVFETDEPWRLELTLPDRRWKPFIQDWLPEPERMPSVSLEDARVFPLRVVTRLPKTLGGGPLDLHIQPGGVGK